MSSYNMVNNSYASQNSWTLNYLLKNELDFQGFGNYPETRWRAIC
jgi:beta-glucosidase